MFKGSLPVAALTYRELIRGRILVLIYPLFLVLLLTVTAFGAVSIGDQVRVVKDFGFFLIAVMVCGVGTIGGSSLIDKEISKKTIFNILSKPICRSSFLLGKFFGIFSLCVIVAASCTLFLLLYCLLLDGNADFSIGLVGFYVLLEAFILCSVSMLCSTIMVTPALSGIISFSLFCVGRGLQHLHALVTQEGITPTVSTIGGALYWILPQTFRFSIANEIVYGALPSTEHLVASVCYAVSYGATLLVIATMIFTKRNFE